RHEEEDDHDQERDHGPGQLDLRAPVDLGRLAALVAGPAAEADDRVGRQPGHDDEDEGRDAEDQVGQIPDLERRRGGGVEDARGLDRRHAAPTYPSIRPRAAALSIATRLPTHSAPPRSRRDITTSAAPRPTPRSARDGAPGPAVVPYPGRPWRAYMRIRTLVGFPSPPNHLA